MICGPFWANFAHFWANILSLFSVSGFISVGKISEKTNEQIPRKIGNRCTDRRTEGQLDKHKFIEPLLLGVQKTKN